jgi:DNA-binding response OmpR family regulator
MNTEVSTRIKIAEDFTSQSPRKVLLLEDDETFTSALTEFLNSHAYEVVKARNGVEGVREIMASDFGVIICDVMMPSLPGDMFYLAVKRIKPYLNARFIFITGHMANPKISGFLEATEALLFEKPFQLEQLMDAIRKVDGSLHGKN